MKYIKRKIYNLLIALRNSIFIAGPGAYIILKNEYDPEAISSFEYTKDIPTIKLSDGTKLSSFEKYNIPIYRKFNIPQTHISCVFSYILRYKYPHFDPGRLINTSPFPRRLFPAIIHRQHMNTFFDIAGQDGEKLKNDFRIRPGDKILEVGAFLGFGTIQMSRLAGQKGKIFCIEADQKAFSCLKDNLKSNSIKNVIAMNDAVGGEDNDKAVIFKGGYQRNSIIKNIIDKSDVQHIAVRRIETICKTNNITPNLIVITINGAELIAIKESLDYLKKIKNLRIICPGWYKDKDGIIGYRLINMLKKAEFKVYFTKGLHIFAMNK